MLINTLLRPQENDEDLLGPKAPYLSVIETLMYLANYIRSNICICCKFVKQDIVLQLQEENGLE